MLLAAVGRLAGAIAVVGAGVWAFLTPNVSPLGATWATVLAFAGGVVMALCQRSLDGARTRPRTGGASAEFGLAWHHPLLCFLGGLAAAVLGLWLLDEATGDAYDGRTMDFLFGLLSAGAGGFFIAFGLSVILARLRRGYALSFDAEGLHHFAIGTVPWHDIRTVSVRTEVHEKTRSHFLVIALTHEGYLRLETATPWTDRLVVGGARFEQEQRQVVLTCAMLEGNPDQLRDTANRAMVAAAGRKAA